MGGGEEGAGRGADGARVEVTEGVGGCTWGTEGAGTGAGATGAGGGAGCSYRLGIGAGAVGCLGCC